jgi:hypothetical protein
MASSLTSTSPYLDCCFKQRSGCHATLHAWEVALMFEATAQLELLLQVMVVVTVMVTALEVFGLAVLATLILGESRKGKRKRAKSPGPHQRLVLTKT